MRHRRAWAGLLALSATALIAGCGSSPSTNAKPWRAAHPDPKEATFDEAAPGLCALTARYPDDAPAAIEYQGSVYVQEAKASTPPSSPGTSVATSGDWTLRATPDKLYLLTPGAMFTYAKSSGC